MRYVCSICCELFEDKDIIMVGWHSGFGGGWLQPYCEECYNKQREEYECKYESVYEDCDYNKDGLWTRIKKYFNLNEEL